MSNQQELHLIWQQLTSCYQQANSCMNRAEAKRLMALAEMLRLEYRHLTSTFQ